LFHPETVARARSGYNYVAHFENALEKIKRKSRAASTSSLAWLPRGEPVKDEFGCHSDEHEPKEPLEQ
jgi:hypothetical protein